MTPTVQSSNWTLSSWFSGVHPPGSSPSEFGTISASCRRSEKSGANSDSAFSPSRLSCTIRSGEHQHLPKRHAQASVDDHGRLVVLDGIRDRHVGKQKRFVHHQHRQCNRPAAGSFGRSVLRTRFGLARGRKEHRRLERRFRRSRLIWMALGLSDASRPHAGTARFRASGDRQRRKTNCLHWRCTRSSNP